MAKKPGKNAGKSTTKKSNPNRIKSKRKITPMLLSIFLVILGFAAIYILEYIYETPWEVSSKNQTEDSLGVENSTEDNNGDLTGDENNTNKNDTSNSAVKADEHNSENERDSDTANNLQVREDSEPDDALTDGNDGASKGDMDNAKDTANNNNQEEKSTSIAAELGVSEVSYHRYTTTDLNIRGDAHSQANRIGAFPTGTQIQVIGELSNNWVKVNYQNADAFVHSAYLSTTDPTARPPRREDSASLVSNPGALDVLVNRDYKLPSGYVPPGLVEPDVQVAPNAPGRLLRSEAAEALERMFSRASQEGITLYARSGYRSYLTQKRLYNNYVKNHGYQAASRFSAQPGHSEHQTGLAMDVTSKSANYRLHQSFANTPEGIWIAVNAHRFGFIIRYPQNKESVTGYIYEPWHLRYLGVDLATAVYESGLTYEEYLGY